MPVLLSVRAADLCCWGDREDRPVKSSGRHEVALGVVEVAVLPEAVVEATEVSKRDFCLSLYMKCQNVHILDGRFILTVSFFV